MDYKKTQAILGNVDIYLIDQILKNRYVTTDVILDAGCGEGRNLKWFYANDYSIYGIDKDLARITEAIKNCPKFANNFKVANLDSLPFGENVFHHIICSAVLHFAQSETHFKGMFTELIRVLKPNGTLFIRMASNIGLDGNAPVVQDSVNKQNGTYYLTRERIQSLMKMYHLELVEPIKTTNVQDVRAMTTLVFKKV